MYTPNGSARTTKTRPDQAPPVSRATRVFVLYGAVFALLCAEAWSAPALFKIAIMAKAPESLAWLLPAVIDGYAVTAIIFGNSIPRSHPARNEVIGNTRRALAITVTANAVYHLLTLAGNKIPTWVDMALLITVTALPVYIADRLVHLYRLAAGTAADSETSAARTAAAAPADSAADRAATGTADRRTAGADDRRRPATADGTRAADALPMPMASSAPMVPTQRSAADRVPTADRPPTAPVGTVGAADVHGADGTADARVIDMRTAGAAVKRNTDQWAAAALPIYRRLLEQTGTPPNAPTLAEALRRAGLGELGASRARDVRKATAELHEAQPEDDSAHDNAQVGAAR